MRLFNFLFNFFDARVDIYELNGKSEFFSGKRHGFGADLMHYPTFSKSFRRFISPFWSEKRKNVKIRKLGRGEKAAGRE